MQDYTIMTDSGCDIAPDVLARWGIRCLDITFTAKNDSAIYRSRDMTVSGFYGRMRKGEVFRTSAINPAVYGAAFEEEFRQGRDVLYIGLSSGLSGTAGMARTAAAELEGKYPGRKAEVPDVLCASAGLGLLLYYASVRKASGAAFGDTERYVPETAPSVCHWFTVEDLAYLRRGGRIGSAAAFTASVLGIKPILHLDDGGYITSVSKVRGRRQSIRALAEEYRARAVKPDGGIYMISHGDCPEDAAALEEMLYERHGVRACLISDIGPVVGAHAGPGTLALFFIGTVR